VRWGWSSADHKQADEHESILIIRGAIDGGVSLMDKRYDGTFRNPRWLGECGSNAGERADRRRARRE